MVVNRVSSVGSDRVIFFHFVKAIAIVWIYCFHFYARKIGDEMIIEAVRSGFLNNLLTTIRTVQQGSCFLIQVLFSYGNIGVDLFIIASGFGLYQSYLLKGGSWKDFYRKRIVRVLPLYYFFLFLVCILAAYVSGNRFYVSPKGLKILAMHVLLVQTFNISYIYYGFFYFIAIIFQLYLIFPLFTKIVARDNLRIPLFLLSLLLPMLGAKLFDLFDIKFFGILVTDYFPTFLFGMLLAGSICNKRSFHSYVFERKYALMSVLALVVVLYVCISGSFDNRTIRVFLALLVFEGITLFFRIIQNRRLAALICFVSFSSYVFYLSHMIFINRILTFFVKRGMAETIGSWIVLGAVILFIAVPSAWFMQLLYNRATVRWMGT